MSILFAMRDAALAAIAIPSHKTAESSFLLMALSTVKLERCGWMCINRTQSICGA